MMIERRSGVMASRPSRPRRRSALVIASSTLDAMHGAASRVLQRHDRIRTLPAPAASRRAAVPSVPLVVRQDAFLERRPDDQAVSREGQDHDVPQRRVRHQERDVRDQVAGVDRMPDERVRPASRRRRGWPARCRSCGRASSSPRSRRTSRRPTNTAVTGSGTRPRRRSDAAAPAPPPRSPSPGGSAAIDRPSARGAGSIVKTTTSDSLTSSSSPVRCCVRRKSPSRLTDSSANSTPTNARDSELGGPFAHRVGRRCISGSPIRSVGAARGTSASGRCSSLSTK